MQIDSCQQCKRRRIECDATIPQCAKCRKKGLPCSGPGKQYRFVDVRKISRDSKKQSQGKLLPLGTSEAQTVAASPSTSDQTHPYSDDFRRGGTALSADSTGVGEAELSLSKPSSSTLPVPLFNESQIQLHSSNLEGLGIRQLYALEILNPQVRMLFNYCRYLVDVLYAPSADASTVSENIAPAMVVVDHSSNGYRNILLPLASQDPLVQRAVSVVAALHLGAKQSHLLQAAEEGRSTIIQRLRKDASYSRHDRVFSLSTWATIILLLVGETVTGGHEFVYLYSMLQSILGCSEHLTKLCPDTGHFLLQQSGMYDFSSHEHTFEDTDEYLGSTSLYPLFLDLPMDS